MEPCLSKLASYLPESFECNPVDQKVEARGENLMKEEASIASQVQTSVIMTPLRKVYFITDLTVLNKNLAKLLTGKKL